ncbi:MAG: VOC family protein [Kofleriaceae bacterium]
MSICAPPVRPTGMQNNIPTGRFVWFEYGSKDVKKAQGFFGELFNWSTVDVPMPQGSYTMISAGDATIGGYPPHMANMDQSYWATHLQVEDAEASAQKAKQLGGTIVVPTMQLGSVGKMAVIEDPTGGHVPLWQPTSREPGGDYANKMGQFCWNELHTPDPEAATKFYAALCGYEANTIDRGRGPYTMLAKDGKSRAGVIKDTQAVWIPYVQVANTDATLEKAKKLGATISMPAINMPIGRIASFVDPQGAALGLVQPA